MTVAKLLRKLLRKQVCFVSIDTSRKRLLIVHGLMVYETQFTGSYFTICDAEKDERFATDWLAVHTVHTILTTTDWQKSFRQYPGYQVISWAYFFNTSISKSDQSLLEGVRIDTITRRKEDAVQDTVVQHR